MNLARKEYKINILIFIFWSAFFLLGCIICFLTDHDFMKSEILAIFAIMIMTVLVVSVILQVMSTNISRIISMIGYLMITFLMFYDRYIQTLDSTDPDGFHQCALQKSYGIDTLDYGGYYTDVLSIIYRMFGRQRIMGQYFNILLVITIEIFCIKIFRMLKVNGKMETLGITMIALSPNFLLINSTLRREAIIEALLTISLYYFVKWYTTKKFRCIMAAVLFSLLACLFHAGCIAAMIGYSLFFILYDSTKNKVRFKLSTIIGFIIILLLFYYLNTNFGQVLFRKFQTDGSIDQLMGKASVGKGGSGYDIGLISTGNIFVDLIVNSPARMVYYLLSPMPWDWRGFKDVIAFVFSSLFYFIGYIYAIRALKNKDIDIDKKNLIIALLFLMIFSCLIFGWGVKNAGTAMRHRDKFIAPYMLMTILSLEQIKIKKRIVITLERTMIKNRIIYKC